MWLPSASGYRIALVFHSPKGWYACSQALCLYWRLWMASPPANWYDSVLWLFWLYCMYIEVLFRSNMSILTEATNLHLYENAAAKFYITVWEYGRGCYQPALKQLLDLVCLSGLPRWGARYKGPRFTWTTAGNTLTGFTWVWPHIVTSSWQTADLWPHSLPGVARLAKRNYCLRGNWPV